jgi:hypothetical protein
LIVVFLAAQVGLLITKPVQTIVAEAFDVAQLVSVQQLAVPVGIVVAKCLEPFPQYHDLNHQEPLCHDFF